MLRALMLLVAALATVLVGCDDDEEPVVLDEETTTTVDDVDETTTTAEETTTTAAEGAPTLEGEVNDRGTQPLQGDSIGIEQGDFFFDPTFVRLGQPATFTVELENVGSVPHTFTIGELDVDQVLQPGDTAQVQVAYPAGSDQLVFICRFHEAQGMKGAFFTS